MSGKDEKPKTITCSYCKHWRYRSSRYMKTGYLDYGICTPIDTMVSERRVLTCERFSLLRR